MKEIPLTQGQFALVDDDDFDYLNQWKWYARFNKDTSSYYALRNSTIINGKSKTICMHRLIMDIADSKIQVDHKDHNTLNNQRSNLRIATHAQNGANRRAKKKGTSKYLGVNWVDRDSKWRASIKSKKSMHIGYFDNEIDAAIAYNNVAAKIHGEFANLNKITA